ncbi:MAG: cysteine--tRNA ligase [Rhodomicrobium sp.]
MTLKLYNTRTRQKEIFEPIDPKAVRMYVCGPTVYDFAHIGNARPVIVFDVLFRLLKHLAAKGKWDGGKGKTKVIYVRNVTDVDDKINARAAQEGILIRELTEKTLTQFHADVAALGCLPPTEEPRATEYVSKPDSPVDMIRMVERLVERAHAYEAEGHVLFSVATDPEYGSLSRRSVDEMRAGARVEVAPYKRDPMDFVLWKPSVGSEPGWDSPWGYGRPGWHLECSAMSAALLGKEFDIHGGGIDLLFPHHENEVAQSTCAHGTKIMANIWMHNGHLQVEGAKMSKSLGNFITIRDLIERFGGRGEPTRLAMLMTHYRQPLNWTEERLQEARFFADALARAVGKHERTSLTFSSPFLEALEDDLNTPAAITELRRLLHCVAEKMSQKFVGDSEHITLLDQLSSSLWLLGFEDISSFDVNRALPHNAELHTRVKSLIDERLAARKAKNWAEADRIRDELTAMGIALKDAKNPATGEIETTWEVAR